MSIDTEILALLADGNRSADSIVAALPDSPELTVRMRIGYLISRGKASLVDGLVVAGGTPKAKKVKAPKVARALPPPKPFDVALWLDGTICIEGAEVTPEGKVLVLPDDAKRMARHVLGIPQEEGGDGR